MMIPRRRIRKGHGVESTEAWIKIPGRIHVTMTTQTDLRLEKTRVEYIENFKIYKDWLKREFSYPGKCFEASKPSCSGGPEKLLIEKSSTSKQR